MFPYQLSKVLADQRIHDMVAAGERHRLVAAAQHPHSGLTESSSRLRVVAAQIARMMALRNGRRSVRASSTVASTSGAGPIGCSA